MILLFGEGPHNKTSVGNFVKIRLLITDFFNICKKLKLKTTSD